LYLSVLDLDTVQWGRWMSASCCKSNASIFWAELNQCGKAASYEEGVASRCESQGTVIASQTHGQGRRDKTADE